MRAPSSIRAATRAVLPVAVALVIASLAPPAGLEPVAWYYFAIFAGVITALVVEPLPAPAIGVVGVTLVAALSKWVLFGPADLSRPGFKLPQQSLQWALSGFSNGTVWLVFGAFMFALGYEKTGLGRRLALNLVRMLGRNTLSLGYATTLADATLAPFTPSNTARSAGTLFPIVSNLPPLYDSLPNHPSARRIGGYLMWTTFAAGCVTSSLFMAACAPNFLALEFIRKIANVEITHQQWFVAAAPFALPLLLGLPLLTYVFHRPEVKTSPAVPQWAAAELARMGPLSRREIILGVLVVLAIVGWIFGAGYFEPSLTALIVVCLMLIFGVVSWKDMAGNHAAWTTLVMLATLVTLASGLSSVGFVKWFGQFVAAHVGGHSATTVVITLVAIYFFSHYLFASLTAHTTAMMPVMLAIGTGIPGLPVDKLGLSLALTTGIMGVITPYATGPGLAFYESGYLPAADFWRLGTIFGLIFLGALLLVGVPVLMAR